MAMIYLHKYGNALLPAHEADAAVVAKWKTGDYIECKVSRPRNAQFHRKFFALMNYGFECFEPEAKIWSGQVAQKSFTRFWKDVVILCGRAKVVLDIQGDVHMEADSISFASMDEDEFSALYERAITVLIERAILTNQNRDEVNAVVEHMLGFA